MAWAPDGLTLAISSHDGYCTLACFNKGELGQVLPSESLPATLRKWLDRAAGLHRGA